MGDIINELEQCHSFGVKHNGNEYITIIITPLRGSELNSTDLERGSNHYTILFLHLILFEYNFQCSDLT